MDPNVHGGRENLEAIAFLQAHERGGGRRAPAGRHAGRGVDRVPGVSRPTYAGGLGFHYKWNMGWMHDTLQYMARDPVHRRWHHHGEMTFGLVYAFNENFVLPLSHDEVVHGKGSLLGKMPGDRWQQFANLRAYYGFMFGHPGKKLLFMGASSRRSASGTTTRAWTGTCWTTRARRRAAPGARPEPAVRETPALHQLDFDAAGFEWIDHHDAERRCWPSCAAATTRALRCWWSATSRRRCTTGCGWACRSAGAYRERLNTDSRHYGGSNVGTPLGWRSAEPVPPATAAPAVDLHRPAAAGHVFFEWTP
jgi:1,4-alpha-glucan branching enzyme